MGDWLSDLDPWVALSAVLLALVSGVAKAFGEVLFGELKWWLKAKVRPWRTPAEVNPACAPPN
jgi:hypothetical protein